jgi:hypothetical protein
MPIQIQFGKGGLNFKLGEPKGQFDPYKHNAAKKPVSTSHPQSQLASKLFADSSV